MKGSDEQEETRRSEAVEEPIPTSEPEVLPKKNGRKKQKNGTPQAETEVVEDIVQQAKEVQRVAEKIYFLSILKRFGLAFAGILILLGAISATAFFFLFFGIFPTNLPKNIEFVIEIGLAMLSVIHILSGLALLAG